MSKTYSIPGMQPDGKKTEAQRERDFGWFWANEDPVVDGENKLLKAARETTTAPFGRSPRGYWD